MTVTVYVKGIVAGYPELPPRSGMHLRRSSLQTSIVFTAVPVLAISRYRSGHRNPDCKSFAVRLLSFARSATRYKHRMRSRKSTSRGWWPCGTRTARVQGPSRTS